MSQELTQAKLKEILDYDPETGVFTYKVRHGRMAAGAVAGTVIKANSHQGGGYRTICLHLDGERRYYGAHRLAWLYMTGSFPVNQLDHKNLNRDDNRFDNLRSATRSQNLGNRTAQSNNTSGLKGVSFHKAARKWVANIQCQGVYKYLGLYETKELAHAAYCAAAKALFGEFHRAV